MQIRPQKKIFCYGKFALTKILGHRSKWTKTAVTIMNEARTTHVSRIHQCCFQFLVTVAPPSNTEVPSKKQAAVDVAVASTSAWVSFFSASQNCTHVTQTSAALSSKSSKLSITVYKIVK
jgi:hypothetical protein